MDSASHASTKQSRSQARQTPISKVLRIVRWVSIVLILGSLLTIFRLLPLEPVIAGLNDWITGLGVWGPVALILVYVTATVLLVPGVVLSLVAGAVFGLVVGVVTVSIGATLGAALAFLIARYVARERIAEMAKENQLFGAVDRAIGEGGWKIVALLRLSPAIPFNVQNYLYGLTPIGFWPCIATSWLAMLPGTFLYVYLGHVTVAAIGADRERTPAEWTFLAIGLLATIAVTVYITRLARQQLKRQVDDSQTGSEENAAESDNSSHPSQSTSNPKGTVLLAIAAVAMVCAAVFTVVYSQSIVEWFTRLFDLPDT